MTAPLPRYSKPRPLLREPGSRLLEGFSPALARPVQFPTRMHFEWWIQLEADPQVRTFCERPAGVQFGGQMITLDFWVQSDTNEYFIVLVSGDPNPGWPALVLGLPVRQIGGAERAAASIATANWQQILGVINATSGNGRQALFSRVLEVISEPITLSQLEARFIGVDLPYLRGATFELLRQGRIRCPDLATSRLSLHSKLEPV